jgi:hypothetical protein
MAPGPITPLNPVIYTVSVDGDFMTFSGAVGTAYGNEITFFPGYF